jgi:hypothetical protein
MESTYNIGLEAEPKASDINLIVKGPMEFNRLQTGGATPEYLLATVRNDQGLVVGGLLGATYLGWLQIHSVWLPDELRGFNYGSELMAIAEGEALRRECSRVFLETYSFQALPFYEKRGYTVISRLPDFPPGGARYAHALLGFGQSVLAYAEEMRRYFLRVQSPAWEVAFVHVVHAHAASAAGEAEKHRASYELAVSAIEAVSNAEERRNLSGTFSRVPKP